MSDFLYENFEIDNITPNSSQFQKRWTKEEKKSFIKKLIIFGAITCILLIILFNDYKKVKVKINESNIKIKDYKDQTANFQNDIKKIREEIKASKADESTLETKYKDLVNEITKLNTTKQTTQNEVDTLQKTFDETYKKCIELKEEIEKKKEPTKPDPPPFPVFPNTTNNEGIRLLEETKLNCTV